MTKHEYAKAFLAYTFKRNDLKYCKVDKEFSSLIKHSCFTTGVTTLKVYESPLGVENSFAFLLKYAYCDACNKVIYAMEEY